jgi:hypothetical protein
LLSEDLLVKRGFGLQVLQQFPEFFLLERFDIGSGFSFYCWEHGERFCLPKLKIYGLIEMIEFTTGTPSQKSFSKFLYWQGFPNDF